MSDFIDRIRQIEQRFFADQLDETDSVRMKSHGKYSWLYRPSHHAETGLITGEDVQLLSQTGKRLLSMGAHPAYLEKVLVELGVPVENILAADNNQELTECAGNIPSIIFDMNKEWLDVGTFDLIIFPESLCIAIGDTLPTAPEGSYANDPLEAQMLAHVIKEALARLRDGGEIRANGPMHHPKVVDAARALLTRETLEPEIEYRRFFLTVRRQK